MRYLLFFLIGGLLSFSSIIYAVEQGEYKHYMGFAISGALLSDNFQKIDFASDDTSVSDDIDSPILTSSDTTEGGYFFVWDRLNLDNQDASSLMFLFVSEDSREVYSDGSIYDGVIGFSGPILAGKYFTKSGFYVGGGGAFLSLSGDVSVSNNPVLPDANLDLSSDRFFAPTLVLGYRGLVSRLEKSHFYMGIDWVRTLPVDVDYEISGFGITVSDTFEDLSISMLSVSFTWAW